MKIQNYTNYAILTDIFECIIIQQLKFFIHIFKYSFCCFPSVLQESSPDAMATLTYFEQVQMRKYCVAALSDALNAKGDFRKFQNPESKEAKAAFSKYVNCRNKAALSYAEALGIGCPAKITSPSVNDFLWFQWKHFVNSMWNEMNAE